jgi:threonylcarbamoyladenosine tRNA methylthiotransferase MtaB
MPTVKFYTIGCKVNQYETQLIREQFLSSGFKEIENNLPSDFYVINTCTVTHKADSDSLNLIASTTKKNPQAKIIVTGCLTEYDEAKIKDINNKIIIVKNKEKENILDHLQNNRTIGHNKTTKNSISYFKGHSRAFLKIQDGCDNFCSYCKVPKVRGRSKSRELNEIIKEAYQLVNNGIKEIVLCGICLGSYGKDLNPKIDLVTVIEALEKIDGLLRLRLSSIEAKDISEELIEKLYQSNIALHRKENYVDIYISQFSPEIMES